MAVAFQQTVKGGGIDSSGVLNITPTENPSFLACAINIPNSGLTVTCSDGTNGSWTSIAAPSLVVSTTYTFYVINTATSSITVTASFGSSQFFSMLIIEFTGQHGTPLGSSSSGSNGSLGSNENINTSGNVSGDSGDAIVALSGNHYAGTWVVGDTVPSGMTLQDSQNQGNAVGNVAVSYAILGSSYNNVVGNKPGTTTYGNTVGFQVVQAAGAAGNPWYAYAQQRKRLEERLRIPIRLPGFAEVMRYGRKAA